MVNKRVLYNPQISLDLSLFCLKKNCISFKQPETFHTKLTTSSVLCIKYFDGWLINILTGWFVSHFTNWVCQSCNSVANHLFRYWFIWEKDFLVSNEILIACFMKFSCSDLIRILERFPHAFNFIYTITLFCWCMLQDIKAQIDVYV